jgi:hypothetical protein
MPTSAASYCGAVCFGVGLPGSVANSVCLSACEAIGGLFSTKPDPPVPIAFDFHPCCKGNGLNTGWALTGRSVAPLVALEYQ